MQLNIRFPNRFKFVIIRNPKTGEQKATAAVCGEKAGIKNIKFSNLKSYMLNGNKVAVLDVKEIESEDELKRVLASYAEAWDVKLPKPTDSTESPSAAAAEGGHS